jgi:hypothetical protein
VYRTHSNALGMIGSFIATAADRCFWRIAARLIQPITV